jgi:poly(A) polymerase
MASPAPKATAVWVVRRLRAAGFEALLAGGCVRDMLLRRPCTDYDVATSATPDQVKRLFPRVLLVGAKFGVAMVIHDSRKVEVATFRSDLSYHDGRRPEGVRFTTSREDALRRDFTINGMFYDPVAKEVIDYVGGREDLRRKIVRTIGEARQRFAEDYLRMLRAVRFAVGLGFELHAAAAEAIRETAGRIEQISGERVFEELWKMLQKPSAADAMRMLADMGLARHVLPEMFLSDGIWQRGVERVGAVAAKRDPLLSLAALVWELPPEAIAKIIRRGGQSNDLKESLAWMAVHRDDWRRAPDMPLAEFKRLLACDDFECLHRLWAVEERKGHPSAPLARRIRARAKGIAPGQVAPPPLVTGSDLKAMGLTEGRLLGEILRRLYDAQLNEEIADRKEGVELAQKLMRELTAQGGAPLNR